MGKIFDYLSDWLDNYYFYNWYQILTFTNTDINTENWIFTNGNADTWNNWTDQSVLLWAKTIGKAQISQPLKNNRPFFGK